LIFKKSLNKGHTNFGIMLADTMNTSQSGNTQVGYIALQPITANNNQLD